MVDLNSLSPSERARQLGKPEGEIGIELSSRLNQVNNLITEHVYDRLDLNAGMSVLEIGFGNGHLLPSLLSRAEGLTYHGIDISQTMVDEARQFNGAIVARGQACFHQASAESIPPEIADLDRAFAVNVIYFWDDPVRPLREIRRVLKPDGISVIAATTPETLASTDFTRPEFGFHSRDGATLIALHEAAGFRRVTVEDYSETVPKLDGTPWTRHYYVIVAEP